MMTWRENGTWDGERRVDFAGTVEIWGMCSRGYLSSMSALSLSFSFCIVCRRFRSFAFIHSIQLPLFEIFLLSVSVLSYGTVIRN